MHFLVIGGAGYIGSHFIHEAIAQGHQCTAYDNLSLGHAKALPKDCPIVIGDLLDEKMLTDTIQRIKPDGVLHFAAFALVGESVKEPSKYYQNNVEGVRILLEVLKGQEKPIPLVFSSSCAVFGAPQTLPMREDDPKNPISPYGRSKLMAEYLIEDYVTAYGLKGISLRYFNACGAHESGAIGEDHQPESHLIPNVLKAALQGKPLKIFGNDFDTPDGTCVRDYIHVKDLAKAHLLAFKKLEGEEAGFYDAYQLGTGSGYSNLEIVQAIGEVLGRKVDFQFDDRRAGDPASLYTATDKAKKELGFEAQHSQLSYIIETAHRWHQNHPNGYPKD